MKKNCIVTECEISVIIPIYNQEEYLEQCIISILNQDIENYQVLLIDDGSIDRSADICKKYVEHSSIFQYIYQENTGLGSARNTGIQYAKGKYLLFLDADDAVEQNCLKTLCTYMDAKGLDILYVDEFICDEKMEIKNVSVTYPYMQPRIKKIDALRHCLQPAHICSRIYKRSLYERLRFSDLWYEDMACFPKLVSISDKIGYYKMPIYYYRQHKNAITHREKDVRNLDVIKAWDEVYHISGLSTEEKYALDCALRDSVAAFLFFRMRYAKGYCEWYEKVMRKTCEPLAIAIDNLTENFLEEDYPLLQQAKMLKDWMLVRNLENLKELYYNGGIYYFTDSAKMYTDNSGEEQLIFSLEGMQLRLYSIKLGKSSHTIKKIWIELWNENLISLTGERKRFVLEKILVKVFIDASLPIYVHG